MKKFLHKLGRYIRAIGRNLPIEQLKTDKRKIVTIILVMVLVLSGVLVHILQNYDDFEVESTEETTEAGQSYYLRFKSHILRYNSDGAFYTGENGELIWNITYEMTKPTVDICGDYLIVYDKGGTAVYIVTQAGQAGHIETAMPITEVNVANKGTIGVLMQEKNESYVDIYDVEGNTLVSGQIHTENSGYPIALALSSDATRLMIAMVNLNDGNVKTAINFYNFGKAGQDAVDNLVATYSYSDMLVPQIDFVEGNRAIAFGDKQIVIYSSASTPKVEKEIFPEGDLRSLFYNEEYFGYVVNGVNEDGEVTNVLSVYNMKGRRAFERTLDISYDSIDFLDNNEILVTNGYETDIYTTLGIRKFTYTFDNNLYEVIPGETARNYTFVMNGYTEKVKLK